MVDFADDRISFLLVFTGRFDLVDAAFCSGNFVYFLRNNRRGSAISPNLERGRPEFLEFAQNDEQEKTNQQHITISSSSDYDFWRIAADC